MKRVGNCEYGVRRTLHLSSGRMKCVTRCSKPHRDRQMKNKNLNELLKRIKNKLYDYTSHCDWTSNCPFCNQLSDDDDGNDTLTQN